MNLQIHMAELECEHRFLLNAANTNRFDIPTYNSIMDAARTKAHEMAECQQEMMAFDIPPIPECAVVSIAVVRAQRAVVGR